MNEYAMKDADFMQFRSNAYALFVKIKRKDHE